MVMLNDEPSQFYYIKVGKGSLNNKGMLNNEPSRFTKLKWVKGALITWAY